MYKDRVYTAEEAIWFEMTKFLSEEGIREVFGEGKTLKEVLGLDIEHGARVFFAGKVMDLFDSSEFCASCARRACEAVELDNPELMRAVYAVEGVSSGNAVHDKEEIKHDLKVLMDGLTYTRHAAASSCWNALAVDVYRTHLKALSACYDSFSESADERIQKEADSQMEHLMEIAQRNRDAREKRDYKGRTAAQGSLIYEHSLGFARAAAAISSARDCLAEFRVLSPAGVDYMLWSILDWMDKKKKDPYGDTSAFIAEEIMQSMPRNAEFPEVYEGGYVLHYEIDRRRRGLPVAFTPLARQ